ncbi:MAG TPA: CsbD family protein [Actinomycetes bacterium]
MVRTMGAKSDQVKGHAKEAAGILTGDKDLESEGKTDRRTGEAEEKIDDAKDKVEETVDKTKDKVEETVDKAKDALHRK